MVVEVYNKMVRGGPPGRVRAVAGKKEREQGKGEAGGRVGRKGASSYGWGLGEEKRLGER